MSLDETILSCCEGNVAKNSLEHILKFDEDNVNKMNVLKNSPYYDNETFINFLENGKKEFCILSTNIQSLNAKIDELKAFIHDLSEHGFEFDAICVQETWLSETDDISLLKLTNYECIPQGKSCSQKGGLMIYLNKKYSYDKMYTLNMYKTWEAQVIEVYGGGLSKNIIMSNVYRPPNDIIDCYREFMDEFFPVLSKFDHSNKEILLSGDFNINLLLVNEKDIFGEFFDSITSLSYFPKITLPTRFSKRKGTLIDNFFCKLSPISMTAESGILIKKFSDHEPYFICLDLIEKQRNVKDKYVFKKYGKKELQSFVDEIRNTNIVSKLDMNENADPNNNYNVLENVIQSAKCKHMPRKQVKFNKHRHKKSGWITNGIIRSISFRDKLYQKLRMSSPDSEIHATYETNLKTYNRILRQNIRMAKKMYYERCFHRYKDDVKKTWSTINSLLCKTKNAKSFPEYFIADGEEITNKLEIANKFNMFFTEIGPKLAREIRITSDKTFKHFLKPLENVSFSFVDVNERELDKIIDQLKPKTSTGWDDISMKLVKLIKTDLLSPLKIIINQMLITGIFPMNLKIAKVIPLFKKGDNTIFSNYRPISLLPAMSKIFEKVIFQQLYEYFQSKHLFYCSQYGFRKGHSTELAALEVVDRIIKDMDNEELPINIYLDLSKAFDTLDHGILLDKLKYYGVRGTAANLFDSYLSDRKQYVEYDGVKSDTASISTGVPQGSVLGPLLFIIYINDIVNVSDVFDAVIYADDTTLSSTLNACNVIHRNNFDTQFINNELGKISEWLKLNKLSLNVNKSKYMIFHTNRRNVPIIHVKIDDIEIQHVTEFNFLGMIVDENISWKCHVNYIANKIAKTVGILNRLKHFIPMNIKVMLYNSLILSHLNYGILAWGFNCGRIIKLQKRAIRTICVAKYNAHTEPLLKTLKMLKIHDIFRLKELKFYYKFVNKMLPDYFCNILNVNQSVHPYDTRVSKNVHITRVNHVYAKKCLRQNLQVTLNNTSASVKDKIHTHSLQGFSNFVKKEYIDSYKLECNIENCYICKTNT